MKITSCDCFEKYDEKHNKSFLDFYFAENFIHVEEREISSGEVINEQLLTWENPGAFFKNICPFCGKKLEVTNNEK